MRVILMTFAAALCCGPALAAMPPPDCAGSVEIANARVTRVEVNGALVLRDGRALLLEGIRLPQGAADRAPAHFADEARVALATLAEAEPLIATAVPPKEDRYDRVRVQGFGAVWLQRALLQQGLARVAIAPDRDECAPDLYEAESAARTARRGIWASSAYRVRGPADDWRADIGSFQIIEGRIAHVTAGADGTVLDFGGSGLSVLIAADDRKSFRAAAFDPRDLEGKRVRVRGLVEDGGGRPRIELSNPAQIEILE